MYVPSGGKDVDCIIITNIRTIIRHTFPIVPCLEATMIEEKATCKCASTSMWPLPGSLDGIYIEAWTMT